MSGKTYLINEVFYSLQGEGKRAGTPNIFIRFAACNLECRIDPGPKSPGGFDCDTEFASGRKVTKQALLEWITLMMSGRLNREWKQPWIILTGGEPALQVDDELIVFFHELGWRLAIETNGSKEVEFGIDWITVSPKVAEHAIKQLFANEVKYVRGYGQPIPETVVSADHYLISPAFDGTSLDEKTLKWCIDLCLDNPKWELSIQNHKAWKVR